MLEAILGSTNAERVLVFLQARGEGFASEMAAFYDTDLYGIQKQLERLEAGGVLISRKIGRTRLYTFNPRYALKDEIRALLERALAFYPQHLQADLLMNRRRPRRKGKPDEVHLTDESN